MSPQTASVVLLLAISILSGCDSAERAWKRARQANNVAAYDGFLKEHPSGAHTAEATRLLEALLLPSAYTYLSKFKGKSGAQNLDVEAKGSGLEVRCGGVTLLDTSGSANDGERGQAVVVQPTDQKFDVTLEQLDFDGLSGALSSHVVMKPAGSTCAIPAQVPVAPKTLPPPTRLFPDAKSSRDVRLRAGTELAGLRFDKDVVVSITAEGRVEVNLERVAARDEQGNSWISRKVAAGIVLVPR